MTTSYNPFHHLQDLHYVWEDGDPIIRLALSELIDRLDFDDPGPYLTAMESAAFPAKVLLRAYASFVPEGERLGLLADDLTDTIDGVRGSVTAAIHRHVTTHDPPWSHDVFNLSQADQDAVLSAMVWTPAEIAQIVAEPNSDAAVALRRRPAAAISEHFTVAGFTDVPVSVWQGGIDPYPVRKRQYSRETGAFYMTRNGCAEWGLTIPRHPSMTDDATVRATIDFATVPEGIVLVVTSSTDDVPDPDNAGESKSEQSTLRIKKGDNAMSRSLTGHDLRYHEWVFTIEQEATE